MSSRLFLLICRCAFIKVYPLRTSLEKTDDDSLKSHHQRIRNKRVLNRITLRFPKTGFLAIVGPSGCGKTTLLNILSGIDEKYQGDYLFKTSRSIILRESRKSAFRLLNVGYVFQDFRLFENDSVMNNLLLLSMCCQMMKRSLKNGTYRRFSTSSV
jgi:putative ABC transport system ATP-binding protein